MYAPRAHSFEVYKYRMGDGTKEDYKASNYFFRSGRGEKNDG